MMSSTAMMARIEELELTLGVGPCVTACQEGVPIAEPDYTKSDPARWLGFGAAALDAGARGSFAFPLVADGTIGSLNVARVDPGPLTALQHSDGIGLAHLMVQLVKMQLDGGGLETVMDDSWSTKRSCTRPWEWSVPNRGCASVGRRGDDQHPPVQITAGRTTPVGTAPSGSHQPDPDRAGEGGLVRAMAHGHGRGLRPVAALRASDQPTTERCRRRHHDRATASGRALHRRLNLGRRCRGGA